MQSIKDPVASNRKNLSQQKLKVFVKLISLISIALWLSLIPHLARAEGTKELTSSGGYRPWTMYQTTGQYFGISYKTIAKVYAKSGETIYTGSSANGLVSGSIKLTAPDGTVYTSTGVLNEGVIQSRSQELAGPAPNPGGYTPFSKVVGATQTGIWTVDFISPNPISTSTVASALTANATWDRTTNQPNNVPTILAWDVTVRNAGGVEQKGRSYTNSYAFTMGAYDPVTLSSVFYILTKDGYKYAVDANALGPFASIFFSNNRGWKTGLNPTYKSASLLPGNVQDPLDPDTANDITNKMFFNRPANDLPSSATSSTGTEWLVVPPVIPTTSNFQYAPSGASGGTFTFSANVAASYEIWMDVNNNGSYTDPVDRLIQGLNTAGTNSVVWDGRNGLGSTVLNPVNFPVRVATRSGEVHFPMIDAESSLSGIKITRLNGLVLPDSIIYWDDTSIFKSGFTSTKSLTGTNSSPGGAHSWGPGGFDGYGDAVGIDTWAFGRGDWKFFGVAISGRVFEDINYGGGAGQNISTASNAEVRPNVRVELYDGAGNFKSATTTDLAGHYEFQSSRVPGGLTAGNYTVRVVNSTVTSSRSTSSVSLLPVQTYRVNASTGTAVADLNRVGGEVPAKEDAPPNLTNATLASLTTATTVAQSIAPVKVGIIHISNVDFGYNFDTIVNTNDSGQGSLRQFIINSNALSNTDLAQSGLTAGKETSIFMIPSGTAVPGIQGTVPSQLTSGVAVINVATKLPAITDANTTIDGRTQTTNVGDNNAGLFGLGGIAGTYSTVGVNQIPLGQVNRPEVELSDGGGNVAIGLEILADDATVAGMSVWGFGTGTNKSESQNQITLGKFIGTTPNRTLIEQNIIGAQANDFSAAGSPGRASTGNNTGNGIYLLSSSNAVIQNNLIGFNAGSGVLSSGNNVNLMVSSNEINGNGTTDTRDGLALENGTSNAKAINNLIINNAANGVSLYKNGINSQLLIENNTIIGSGTTLSGEIAGIAAADTTGGNDIIRRNIITQSKGAGIWLETNASTLKITQNSIYENAGLGIDLKGGDAGTGNQTILAGTVTPNNGVVGAGVANNGLDYPIITSSSLSSGTLAVKGYVGNTSVGSTTFNNLTLEFFIADDDLNNNGAVIVGDAKSKPHGEGKTYIGSCPTDGSGLFSCSFTNAVTTTITNAKNITATATDSVGNTSEFSALPSSNANVLLVKRITAINGDRIQNPNDNIPLNVFVDDGLTNDNNANWPTPVSGTPPISTFLQGVINAGKVKPGDRIEYTIYFLNAEDGDANNVKICDRITGSQTFQLNAYGPNKDIQIHKGDGPFTNWTSVTTFDLTSAADTGDRAELMATTSAPTSCHLDMTTGGTADTGTLVIDITGAGNSNQPNWSPMTGASGPGTANSYGFIRFTTKVNP